MVFRSSVFMNLVLCNNEVSVDRGHVLLHYNAWGWGSISSASSPPHLGGKCRDLAQDQNQGDDSREKSGDLEGKPGLLSKPR